MMRGKKTLLIAALCLLLSMPLHGFAETSMLPAVMRERSLRAEKTPPGETSPAPAAEPSPTPSPSPSRPPEPEDGFPLLGHRTRSLRVDMAA